MPVPDELPLLSLYLTDRCNSRCVSCDHWRHGRSDLSSDSVRALLPSLRALRTRIVQLSGGEPLVHPQWQAITQLLRDAGVQVWLLTAGLALAKQAAAVAHSVDRLIVSLDGADRATYQTIRGVDAFDKVCEGIRAAAGLGMRPTLRVTLQRRNYRQLPEFIRLARTLGAVHISFLTVDVANGQAFGRSGTPSLGRSANGTHDNSGDGGLSLQLADLPILERVLDAVEYEFAAEFACGFIAESPHKLRRLHHYFAAVCGVTAYPSVNCHAPELSAVVDASSRVHPCYFIAADGAPGSDLQSALSAPGMRALRERIRAGERRECRTCVCTLSRAPAA